jgi:hypothetical protein
VRLSQLRSLKLVLVVCKALLVIATSFKSSHSYSKLISFRSVTSHNLFISMPEQQPPFFSEPVVTIILEGNSVKYRFISDVLPCASVSESKNLQSKGAMRRL